MAEYKLALKDDDFGLILPYVKNDNITDINYNGEDLWINDLEKGRYKVENSGITDLWIAQFAQKLSNNMKVQFNKSQPFLEAETDMLRISIIHKDVTATGYSVSIRKTPPVRRLSYDKMIQDKYCEDNLEVFLANAVKCGFNIIVCGLPGTGKTELVKYLTKYIPPYEKTITIEDNLEIRYRAINPGKDCVEMKVSDLMSYDQAIKLSMRQLPTWVLIAETRGKEVTELIKALSTGTHCLTTLHTDSVRKVPERMRNMSPDVNVNDIYMFIDIAVQVKSFVKEGQKIRRKITEVALIYHNVETGENKVIMLYENGKFTNNDIPSDMMYQFWNGGIKKPFEHNELIDADTKLERQSLSQKTTEDIVEKEVVEESADNAEDFTIN